MIFLRTYGLYFVFILALILNISFWMQAKHVREAWSNVPYPPSRECLSMMSLGDDQIAYRMTGYFLQNLGSAGGRSEPLSAYNYELLEKWLFASNDLDPYSNYIPYLAAYYFSASQNKEQVQYLINYLNTNGQVDAPEKWRWSAQAVYLSQFILGNNEQALRLANELAMREGISAWAKQLPAFINIKMGNKEAAYGVLLSMLESERDRLAPEEINQIVDIICNRTLDKVDAAQNPLCQNLK